MAQWLQFVGYPGLSTIGVPVQEANLLVNYTIYMAYKKSDRSQIAPKFLWYLPQFIP